ncbi:hypothetical protein WG68_00150 [Arsukibacterium ikkense]|uniref:Uncharacterized protein n=1 Tax=Arsukibacterium ikkense TaxID=336831 RepID=A0A0M2VDC7_9GAMM|nr:hypothetical protein [Arsukibacterium ikkense]KKO47108.1 hypothetical protein WG68_00150 [Arsukibacterium ikkense]
MALNALVKGPTDAKPLSKLVFYAKRARHASIKWSVTVVAAAGLASTVIGVAAAGMLMWWPRIDAVFGAL